MKTFQTKDFSIFKRHESNRAIDPSNLAKIMASIQTKNLLQFRPILVDKDMNVIDGQHRLEAAKKLDCEIFYQIDDLAQSTDIPLLNINQRVWKLEDYLNFYVSIGNENYMKLESFTNRNNIDLRQALRLLFTWGGNIGKTFRKGALKFPDKDSILFAENKLQTFIQVTDVIRIHAPNGRKLCSRSKFNEALLDFVAQEGVDDERLKKMIVLHSHKIHECVDSPSYCDMLKKIYNWNLRDKIE